VPTTSRPPRPSPLENRRRDVRNPSGLLSLRRTKTPFEYRFICKCCAQFVGPGLARKSRHSLSAVRPFVFRFAPPRTLKFRTVARIEIEENRGNRYARASPAIVQRIAYETVDNVRRRRRETIGYASRFRFERQKYKTVGKNRVFTYARVQHAFRRVSNYILFSRARRYDDVSCVFFKNFVFIVDGFGCSATVLRSRAYTNT